MIYSVGRCFISNAYIYIYIYIYIYVYIYIYIYIFIYLFFFFSNFYPGPIYRFCIKYSLPVDPAFTNVNMFTYI